MNKTEQCRKIYRHCFGEDIEFENLLFDTCGEYIRYLEEDGEILSFLFLLPCKIRTEEKTLDGGYIFAAATAEKHRNRGLMSTLLKKSGAENLDILILRPANDSLVKFYEKAGFTAITAQDIKSKTPEFIPTDNFAILASEEKTNEGKFTAMVNRFNTLCEDIYFLCSMR